MSFDFIAYLSKNTSKHCVLVIYRHIGKLNSLIFILRLFCLSCRKNNRGKKVTFFVVLHFVKSFVWHRWFFTQYSYYCDFLCSGIESRLRDHHHHVWVCYIDTPKITVWCMSLIWIHTNYFSVYTICVSEHYMDIVIYIPGSGQQVSATFLNITITVWLQSQVHCVTYYFVLIVFLC